MKTALTIIVGMTLISTVGNLGIAAGDTTEETMAGQAKPLTEPLLEIVEETPEPVMIEKPKPEIKINEARNREQIAEAKRKEVERKAAEQAEKERIEKEQAEKEQAEKERLEKEQAAEQAKDLQVTENEQPEPQPVAASNISLLFAQIVHAETNGEPYTGKVAVAEVILNRVKSNQFPNSVEEVVYQSGQFSPVSDGSINNNPTEEDYRAIAEAESGSNYAQGALYFYNPEIATARDLDAFTTITTIGGHTFK